MKCFVQMRVFHLASLLDKAEDGKVVIYGDESSVDACLNALGKSFTLVHVDKVPDKKKDEIET